ncbi:MAG: response regulator transcription factor, partial [Vulcanimicrobiaceae bacterium]
RFVTSARIAIVDDDRAMRDMLELVLTREGYEVRTAQDGPAALMLVREWSPDAVVLDVMMPRLDGITLLPMLREVTQAPILMLTAKGEVEDKVRSLASGADDYLTKPFVVEELLARLQAKLRRPQLIDDASVRWRDLTVDATTRDVFRARERIELTQREFELLDTLIREPRRVFGKEHLLELIWGHDFEGGANIVETYISYLRGKLDRPADASYIRTVRGVGYGMAPPA